MAKRRGWRMAISVGLLMLAVSAPAVLPAQGATATFYSDRSTFEAALAARVTDDYGSPPYPAGFGLYSNTIFSAYKGQTDYYTTGHSNLNIHQGNDTYCAGCNGSFQLSFQTTSVSLSGTGVYGVGLDILSNSNDLPYWAYITYGDGATANVQLDVVAGEPYSFFGVTAPELIVSIHFGLQDGVSTTSGGFVMDNLTIGAQYGPYVHYEPLCVSQAED